MVQLIRNGGSLPSCTSKVLTSGTVEVERQYASYVSCSQFCGTPLLSGVDARVSESRTVMRMLFLSAAFAPNAMSKRNACMAAILHILIQPTPPISASKAHRYGDLAAESEARVNAAGHAADGGLGSLFHLGPAAALPRGRR